jgi:hypothetical protein
MSLIFFHRAECIVRKTMPSTVMDVGAARTAPQRDGVKITADNHDRKEILLNLFAADRTVEPTLLSFGGCDTILRSIPPANNQCSPSKACTTNNKRSHMAA